MSPALQVSVATEYISSLCTTASCPAGADGIPRHAERAGGQRGDAAGAAEQLRDGRLAEVRGRRGVDRRSADLALLR